MTGLIMVGGVSIIVAVFFIFVFIGFKIMPLFRSAEVSDAKVWPVDAGEVVSFGIDEWWEVAYFVRADGSVFFRDLSDKHGQGEGRGYFEVEAEIPEDFAVAAFRHDTLRDRLLIGSGDGRIIIRDISFAPDHSGGAGTRVIVPKVESLPVLTPGKEGFPILDIAFAQSQTRRLLAVIQVEEGNYDVHLVTLTQRRTPFGMGPLQVGERFSLGKLLRKKPERILVPENADSVLVAYGDGEVDFFRLTAAGQLALEQTFVPIVRDGRAVPIDRMDFVLGDQTVIFFDASGYHRGWNLAFIEEIESRQFIPSKDFRPHDGPVELFAASRRNKTFLTTAGNEARLTLMTTMADRWVGQLDFQPKQAIIAPRFNGLIFLDTENRLHFKQMVDEHPIAGFRTFFTPIQYEGRPGRIFDWQSDGGADFERKLSMVPLMIGTLKGTIYAMFIAVPVALLSAIYVSQFLRPELKKVVKPTMEIMASLPSVILGFFAGMWLSPVISNAVPSVVLASMGIFVGAIVIGVIWSFVPSRIRVLVPSGMEFVVVVIPAALFAWLGWTLGSVVEDWLFLQYDENLQRDIGSFRMWVVNFLGWDFETRNALVVGFAMGFAVIPIIFTISEDSLSNVPNAFRSGSLALGASRWQTAVRIVLPTAAAGIFSALMIGFGRAIGETMIMVMATGNSVVQDFNPFTGMRTLSANIAVEISEAEQNGTLYRTLFLCAFILFVFTFTLNTIAEILRQWLRKRYRAVE